MLLLTVKLSAQAYSNSEVQPNLTDSNVFLDASSNFNSSANGSHSLGKGLVFPDTDLTQFEFDMTLADGIYFPSYFDGMVVYNVGNGNTMTGGDNPTAPSAVTPGFYYFSNPNGTTNGNVADGVWLPLGSGGSSQVQIGTTESITNLVLAGEPVYAIKGTFTADGTTTSATLANPAGMTSLYRITIYKDGAVYGTGVYSYDKSNGQAYTGNPGVSVVYPAGEYEYTMEYLK
ncbi:hypothetical protein [Moheibacter sediminis]|uniref:Uncharacterized protein n=1 Tax=Moheibacter sediminis TaxID=1434700 RepID=A0A1W2ASD1_9FLAO|nr:hypothetical protein [Moheibacter sediminis]SMC63108.1 hypothetical protein SAMN06296427_10517 [Moheibacter sediminis]